jgi:hyaluronate lyase
VNQQKDGGVWNVLGVYTFNAGTGGNVKIKNDNTVGFVVADAVQFELVQ